MKENGVLLHISSLPSQYGIGSLGKSAFLFVDFLAEAGVNYWQMLPVSVTSFGDSPYQSPSAFAGNPYFIDLDLLVGAGLLSDDDVSPLKNATDNDHINYDFLYSSRYPVLLKAFSNFTPDKHFNKFVKDNRHWVLNFALFMALKHKFDGKPFDLWPKQFKFYHNITPDSVKPLKNDVEFWLFLQYQFHLQMSFLKNYANMSGVKLIGDIPLYVAYDSADVWAHPELFKLKKNMQPTCVAGVPPDYFSEKGQLWGNPIYNWPVHKESGFSWWHKRLEKQLEYFDKIRIDHFRGLDSFYKIPYGMTDATVGRWQKGVSLKVFEGIKDKLRDRIIAEDLGIITDSVKRMVKRSGYPSMKVFQFAFDGKPDNEHLPQNQARNTVYYTGTHDNDTLYGWYNSLPENTKQAVKQNVGASCDDDVQKCVLKACMASNADIVIVPMQDYLYEDNSCRMNTPGVCENNWQYVMPSNYYKSKNIIENAVSYRPEY